MSGLHLEFVAVDADRDVLVWHVVSYCGEYGDYEMARHTRDVGRLVCVDGEFFFTATGAARTMTLKSSVFDDHPRSGFDVMHEIYALVGQRTALDICTRCEQEPEPRYTD